MRAIRQLAPGGWRLLSLEEFPLIGAVPKNYLAYGDPESPLAVGFIAKRGRRPLGRLRECVTEEIISKIGAMLPVVMARSALVRIGPSWGPEADVRFLSRNFLRRGYEDLAHGIEIVAQYFASNPQDVEDAFGLKSKGLAEQHFYTVHNMVQVLNWFCHARSEEEHHGVMTGFARMLAFDAFIGAPDRHALNWGVVRPSAGRTGRWRFAPLFDTARGLFREKDDRTLSAIEGRGNRSDEIAQYAERSFPVFGTGAPGRTRVNHFDLIECAVAEFPTDLGLPVASFVRSINVDKVTLMIARRFRRILTPVRIRFIQELLRYRLHRLKLIVEGTGK